MKFWEGEGTEIPPEAYIESQSMYIECHYTSCRAKFKAKKNQRYHNRKCTREARKEKDRLRKRKWRPAQYESKIGKRIEEFYLSGTARLGAPCVRSLDSKKKHFYRCDTCGDWWLRPARMLNVYCDKKCRLCYRSKQRRLRRQKASRRKENRSGSAARRLGVGKGGKSERGHPIYSEN